MTGADCPITDLKLRLFNSLLTLINNEFNVLIMHLKINKQELNAMELLYQACSFYNQLLRGTKCVPKMEKGGASFKNSKEQIKKKDKKKGGSPPHTKPGMKSITRLQNWVSHIVVRLLGTKKAGKLVLK